ncbi:heme ABC transporter ATP-binding protein [Paenibacillus sp. OV219]|uniref:heme ABC transporter ATP-binding protein n=1 Tax=Paenibacillus sp. OV219 TaxID=1884377 RepID=UPI0008C12888|nr:heme ABC transporter ATP-binding protein [Paenibacillus sp. OV219]SEN35936.1 iron complex transport system ATP-binding protein [Paenibacillus sp. OV219]
MIEVKQVSKRIGPKSLLQEISFSAEKGRMYGIIGPNGAGKTTLLQLLSGMDAPTSGEVLLQGQAITSIKRKELAKRVAVLQQGGIPAAAFTVREVVQMGRFPFQNWLGEERLDSEQLIDDAIETMGLTSLAHRQVDRLSGGERQRVALAKVMVQEPELLLLDEPTTYLDIGYQVQLLDTVKRWQQERQLTVIAVLHDLNLAAHYCDELLVLKQGNTAAYGPPSTIMRPELILEVFGAKAVILPHPETGVPQLLLAPSVPPSETR